MLIGTVTPKDKIARLAPHRATIAFAASVSLAAAGAVGADGTDADIANLKRHVERLASEEWQGRLTGTEGARFAADYLAQELVELGAEPLPGEDDFFLDFDFTAGTKDSGSSLTLGPEDGPEETKVRFTGAETVQALSFSESGSVTAPAVFAGYGMVVPEADGFSYDAFAGLDVDGKIVVLFRYFPEDAEGDMRGRLARFSGLRYKALQARERGAKAIIVITGPRSPNKGEVVPMTFDAAIAGSALVAVSASGDVAAQLLSHGSDKTVEEIQQSFDDANPHSVGFDLNGLELTVEAKVEREQRVGRNVVGVLSRKAAGFAEPLDEPYVLLGAHFDHLGRGRSAGSLADKDEADAVHYGADDNASGVAALLATARRLAESEGRRVVLGFWSGEELGILGSAAFVKEGILDSDEISAYINFDMVGRVRDNKLSLQAVGSSPGWTQVIEQSNVPVGFDLELQEDPYLPTDSSSFNQASVPTLNFFSGSHSDYHRPSDTADKINYEDLDRVSQLGALIARRVGRRAEPLEFALVERKVEEGGGRDGLRAFTGTIPDYGTEVDGLLLSGVIEGGPAEEAGIQGGDIIIEFAGQAIANVYDYTYALDAVKVDEPVTVVFTRDGEEHRVTMTPRARK